MASNRCERGKTSEVKKLRKEVLEKIRVKPELQVLL